METTADTIAVEATRRAESRRRWAARADQIGATNVAAGARRLADRQDDIAGLWARLALL